MAESVNVVENLEDYMSQQLIDLCQRHEVMIVGSNGQQTHAPVTEGPTMSVSQSDFSFATEYLGPIWNKVVDRMSRHPTFLLSTLQGSDKEFTEPLLTMYAKLYLEPALSARQQTMLGFFRSDYLSLVPHSTTNGHKRWRHVEINTISAAFPALSTRVARLHSALHPELSVAQSASEEGVVAALAAAHKHFCETRSAHGAEPVVCFVVPENERNTGDQRLIAEGLAAQEIKSLRVSLNFLAGAGNETPKLRLESHSGEAEVFLEGQWTPVSLFYFRSCHDVSDFPVPKCWTARELIEASTAIKCPSLPYHLCTWKRVQQALLDPVTLRKFVDSDEEAAALTSTMVRQVRLDGPGAEDAMEAAEREPGEWVLKTQKEGTGKLFADEEMVKLLTLRKVHPDQFPTFAREHLLMERIHSAKIPGTIVRTGVRHNFEDLEVEFGAYSCILSDGKTCFLNKAAGHLARTKSGGQTGGGVMSGVAALDSIMIQQ